MPNYKEKYCTRKSRDVEQLKCLAQYRVPKCTFFQDQYNYIYRGKYNSKEWTESEKEAFCSKPNNDEYYRFELITKDIEYTLSNAKKITMKTTQFQFNTSNFGAIQIHNFFNKTQSSELYKNFMRYQITPRRDTFKILVNKYKKQWKSYFELKFDKLSTYASIKRIHVNGYRSWNICAGKKDKTFQSSMTNEDLFTNKINGFYGYSKHLETTRDILHVSVKHGIIGEKEINTFYGDNFSKLCNNTITYNAGSSMHVHKDISLPQKKDGFDLQLIAIGTLEVIDFEYTKGNKLLSFSGTAKMLMNPMNINQRPGDLTIIHPPATTKWWHFVPCLQALSSTTMQWRKWLG